MHPLLCLVLIHNFHVLFLVDVVPTKFLVVLTKFLEYPYNTWNSMSDNLLASTSFSYSSGDSFFSYCLGVVLLPPHFSCLFLFALTSCLHEVPYVVGILWDPVFLIS